MEKEFSKSFIHYFIKEHASPFLNENKKIIVQFIFTLFFIAIGIWFIQHESAELIDVKNVLLSSRWQWVLAGIGLTAIYILLQGQMYVLSFASAKTRVSLFDSIILFIKRNFISVFLPAGGISSLAFFTDTIENKGIKKSQIHFASSIYGFVGILTVVMVALPAFIYALFEGTVGSGEWFALGTVLMLIIKLYLIYRSIIKKGIVFAGIAKFFPAAIVFMNDLQNSRIDRQKFLQTIYISMIIEFIGIAHLYVAMIALNFNPSLFAAMMGYIISVIFLIISPFLRGLGAIEVSMTYVLIRFGFGNIEAIATTFLYRFFEFWMPLLVGIFTFLSKVNKLLMRVLPAFFMLMLGLVNVISVMTPAIPERLKSLKDFLPVHIIHTSNFLVLFAGLFLLVTAAFMLKGLRMAWWFALFLSILSFIGHITKAIDYEEAIFALIVIFILIVTYKEYYIKTNPKLKNIGFQTSIFLTAATLIYGIVGFYFLAKNHFNIDFSFLQSLQYTLQYFFLIGSNELMPNTAFAHEFLYSINISGFVSIAFLIYTLVRNYSHQKNVNDEEFALANDLIKSYGNSSLDYFKVYNDKMIFVSKSKKAFIAYRISGNYAVALENPVTANKQEFFACINEFDKYCYDSGLKSIYYRVDEASLNFYHQLRKKDLFLGQEAIVNISTFNLEGGNKKSLRNALNKIVDRGFKTTIHLPPVKDGVLQKLKSVSDEWLYNMKRNEIIFSQGMFVWDELKQQTIITVENAEEKIVAFLNIIPDHVEGEATYDLIRKTNDAPNGVLDFILIELFNYLKTLNYTYVNLGFAPMSGMDDPHTFPERSMKFAYDKIKSFSHYKGLREYKEKFEPDWVNKYLIYQHDYDLLNIPSVLSKVIKP